MKGKKKRKKKNTRDEERVEVRDPERIEIAVDYHGELRVQLEPVAAARRARIKARYVSRALLQLWSGIPLGVTVADVGTLFVHIVPN